MSSRYHDGALLDIVVDWQAATVTLRIYINRAAIDASSLPFGGQQEHQELHEPELPTGTYSVIVRGFVDLRVPQQRPWGPSVYVDDLSLEEQPDGSVRLSVQMQSGDVIEVVGGMVEEAADSPADNEA